MSDTGIELASKTHLRFEKVQHTDEVLVLDRGEIPWLPKNENITLIHLTLVTRKVSGQNQEFYIGSAIRGKTLVSAAQELHRTNKALLADKLFYAATERLLDGQLGEKDRIRNPRTKEKAAHGRDIWYTGNSNAVRIYFMEFDRRNGKRVIIRVAACHSKKCEEEVYRIIGTQTSKSVRQSLYG